MNVPFYIPSLGKEERRAVDEVLKNNWLTMGQTTFRFEEEFAKYIGAPYCIAVSSCTAAMFLVIQGLKALKKKMPKVIIPSYTFTATAAVFAQSGIDFEFEDIEEETFLMKKTSNLSVPVHFAGLYNDQPNILFEDSAHRIIKNSFNGNITCFSFYAVKNMTTGEGGMIATDNKELADWLKKARLHGISADAWKRYDKKGGAKIYEVEFPGWKYNTTDFQSAMGLVQLKKLDNMQIKRKAVVDRYNDRLESGIDRDANHLYPVLVNKREEFMSYLKENNIGFSFHFPPLHLQPAYKKKKRKLPVTEYVGERVVTLPLYPGLKPAQVDYVAKHVRIWWKKYGKPEFLK
jgi:dTDP-4-amino-4,6-dideoxygalactose transaminase